MATTQLTTGERARVGDKLTPVWMFAAGVSEAAQVSGVASTQHSAFALLRSALRVSSAIALRYGALRALRDRLGVHGSAKAAVTLHVALPRSTLAIKAHLTPALLVNLRTNLRLRSSLLLATGAVLRDRAVLTNALLIRATYRAALRSAVQLTARSQVANGVVLREAARAAATVTAIVRGIVAASDGLVAVDASRHHLVALIVSREGVDVSAQEALRLTFRQTVRDRCHVVLGLYDGGTDATTWAVNARTGAVTEYRNFDFTSFARLADGRFIGTGPQGLYELTGDDDAGDPIIADMISGLLEMTGTNLTGLRAAYLAVRGAGDFLLRLTADEGKSTTYRVTTRSMHTARCNVGKGWRARFFQYQLVSTGQDFDLQGVEFLPITSIRRI